MSIFDYMIFTGGKFDEFVVNAKKYSEEEALELFKSEVDLNIEDKYERWCKYYVKVPDWCGYDGDEGCYTYCSKGERGAFPVWVIEFK